MGICFVSLIFMELGLVHLDSFRILQQKIIFKSLMKQVMAVIRQNV